MFEGLTFKVAEGPERLEALALTRNVYGQDLGHIPTDGKDDVAHSLIAVDSAREVVASFRLLGPEARPFDLEERVDLEALLGPNRSPALVGRLCIRPDYRDIRRGAFLQMGMLKLAHTFACRQSITDLLLYTYPNLIAFYRGSFFDITKITFDHPDWGDVHLMRLNIVDLPARCARSRSAVAKLLAATDLPNFAV